MNFDIMVAEDGVVIIDLIDYDDTYDSTINWAIRRLAQFNATFYKCDTSTIVARVSGDVGTLESMLHYDLFGRST